jgi:hypothetical protein
VVTPAGTTRAPVDTPVNDTEGDDIDIDGLVIALLAIVAPWWIPWGLTFPFKFKIDVNGEVGD